MSPSTTGRCYQTREWRQPTNESAAWRHGSQSQLYSFFWCGRPDPYSFFWSTGWEVISKFPSHSSLDTALHWEEAWSCNCWLLTTGEGGAALITNHHCYTGAISGDLIYTETLSIQQSKGYFLQRSIFVDWTFYRVACGSKMEILAKTSPYFSQLSSHNNKSHLYFDSAAPVPSRGRQQ